MGQKMNMKISPVNLFLGLIAVGLTASGSFHASAAMTRLDPRSGSKMRVEGTSIIHDWQVESRLILGYIEGGSNFPLVPGQSATPGKVDVQGQATVKVTSLRSIEKDGKAYSDTMDQKMYDMMSSTNYPQI